MGIRLGVVLALLVLAGCGERGDATGRASSDRTDLDGTTWVGTRITEAGVPRALAGGSSLRIEFREGSIRVQAGCNQLGGRYRLSADELTVEPLGGTDMGCEQALMDQDTWLAGTVFAAPLTAKVATNTLTLSREGLELVLTDRAVASPDVPLVGTSWLLDGIREGDTVSSVPAGVTATLRFDDGAVAAGDGCNGGTGPAEVSAASIRLGDLTWTTKGCLDRARQQTAAVVHAVLAGPVRWSVTEKALTLTKGRRGLVYRAAP